MSEVSFGAGAVAAESVADNATPVEQPTPTQESPGVPAHRPSLMMSQWVPTLDQITVPVINLVQNIGMLKDNFTPGQVVYDQRVVLYSPPVIKNGQVVTPGSKPVIITCLGFQPIRFSEKVPGGGRGLIVKTEADVVRNGGTVSWEEWNKKKASGLKYFEELATALFAIERPESVADDDTVFTFAVGDVKYALAKVHFHGSTYTAACKNGLFREYAIGCLKKGGYPSFSFAMATREKPFSTGNKSWIPTLVPVKPSTPEFLEFAKQVLGGA